jgi:DNA invertase Pin-like site-specific DNA recombinase
MVKILGYGRTSTDKQEMSPEVQAAVIDGWLKMQTASGAIKDPEYLGFQFDEAVSAAMPLLQRPVGQLVPVLLSRGDILVVAKHDRAFRSGGDTEKTLEQLAIAGIRMVMLNLNIDTSTHEGILMATILGAASRWERENIRKRTKEAMQLKKLRGEPLAAQPFGWMAVGPRNRKKWRPDLDKRRLGEFCLLKLLEGWTVASIRAAIASNPERFGRTAEMATPTLEYVKIWAGYAALEWPRMYMAQLKEKYGSNIFSIASVVHQWEIRNGKPTTSQVN